MKVALVQHDVVFEDARATLAQLGPRVKEAAGEGARLVVLTEMFATGFSMAAEQVAETAGEGPGWHFLLKMAAETGAALCGSLPVKEVGNERPFNRFVCAFPDGRTLSYEKIHPFSYAGEDACYEAGSAVVTFEWGGVAITPFVCYDLRFGDTFWAVADRTVCYVVVSNWPAARQAHWRALAIARAVENQAYVLATNRVGSGGGVDYAGGTIAVGPFGEVLAEAGSEEEVIYAELSPERVRQVREEYPFLRDRRGFSLGPGR